MTRGVGWTRYGLTVLRVIVGLVFVGAGLGKLVDHARAVDEFTRWGIAAPGLSSYTVGVSEVVGGTLLLIGLATRWVALPLSLIMLVAMSTAGVTDGGQHLVLPPALALLCLVVARRGGGAYRLRAIPARRMGVVAPIMIALVVASGSSAQGGHVSSGSDSEARAWTAPTAGSLVGAWSITVTLPGEPVDPHLGTFGADGTFVETARPVQPAPADAPFRLIFPSAGHGAWMATGDHAATLRFVRLLSDEHGAYLGTVTAPVALVLSADGQRLTGPLTYDVADAVGAVFDTGGGTLDATRIGIEPAGTPTTGT